MAGRVPKRSTREALAESLDLNLFGEVMRWDAGVGLIGAIGGGLLAASDRNDLMAVIAVVLTVVSLVVAAVISGATVLAAFMDQPFLRKLAAIGKRPGYFLAPLVFTALIGIAAAFSLLVWMAILDGPTVGVVLAGGFSGFFACWALASLIPDLVIIAELAEIKATAAGIPDDSV